jgi:arylsulfatase A-like enzyme
MPAYSSRVTPRLALAALALTTLAAGCSTTSAPPPPQIHLHHHVRHSPVVWAPSVWPDGAPREAVPGPLLPTGATTATPAWAPYTHRPNILMITSDDLSTLDVKYMPHVRRLIGDQGVTFGDAIAPTPLCVPARASLMSGQYAHNHRATSISGVAGGYGRFDQQDTIAQALQADGYDTLMTGKYMNGYGRDNPPTQVPPGWTDWRATVDPSTYNFYAPKINHNGVLRRHHGYTTSIMSRQADDMLRSPERERRPWFAWVSYVAPHDGGPDNPASKGWSFKTTVPDRRDLRRYTHLGLPHRPDLFHHGQVPHASPSLRHIPRDERHQVMLVHRRRVQAAQAVDRAVASQIRTLRRTGQLADTIVIFGADNGYATGEHDIVGKLWEYDEIERIPLLMRGPGIPVHRRVDTAITNPDIAATILQAAGATSLRPLDGVGMLPWLDQPTQWRVTPVEGYAVDGQRRLYVGVRLGPWTYVQYSAGGEEMYDRATDPYEMHDLVGDPAYAAQLQQMRALTAEYENCAGDSCPQQFFPAPGAKGTGVSAAGRRRT